MSNSFKAALYTGLFTFIGTTAIALLGLLAAVTDFINGNDPSLADDLSIFTRVVMSALVALAGALVNWVIRALQAKGVIPGAPPQYQPKK